MPFFELEDRGCTPGFGAGDRTDPYYGGMWTQGSTAVWMSRNLARMQVASGLARMPRALDMSEAEARDALASTRSLGPRMAALGAVDQWRTCSAEQLAAITGFGRLAVRDTRTMTALFALGVLDLGAFTSELLPGAAARRAPLYRPSRTDAFAKEVAPLLSYEQRVAITGGLPWDFRRQYDRHNLLSVELGLRVAQFCEVGTVLGEKLSTVDLLAGAGLGLPSVTEDRGSDLTIVRADGLRIAVELTASVGRDFEEKVRRWARLLAERPLATSGLTVVFVEAAPHDGSHRFGSGLSLRAQVHKAVGQVVREFPGVGSDRVAERIGVVSWSQWFPAPGYATAEFTRLEVDRPTGPAADRWQRASMLDVIDRPLAATNPAALTAVIDNASLLLGTPHWLRTGRAPRVWEALTGPVGWDELPCPPLSRPGRAAAPRPQVGALGFGQPAVRSTVRWAQPPAVRVPRAPAPVVDPAEPDRHVVALW
ncbi:hypothetical protein HF998_02415 [Cellulomonas hominis]|uniref:Uncharacterized protein n=1 Tax=Cellulomonas hominis TaxID=156981 RepID=A0A7W8WBG2_9CELL|nr:hypothetical protein [Cellulomonas hominis]MBB5474679.1 hypothetical protein [Cellulomonas hominis]NKY05841.1 hypothetical protein [Cellulomonas hominis]